MRLILALFFALAASTATAFGKDDMRALMLAGDVAGAEAAMAAAHARAVADNASQDDLRLAYTALSVSDPRAWDFVDVWRTAAPQSPYAMIARAWQHNARAEWMRGGDYAARVWPEAMRSFYDHKRQGMDLAQAAYAMAPDLVPASDAVIVMQRATHAISPRAWDRTVAAIMAATPNRGTLLRLAGTAEPQWGGGGIPAVVALCDTYAGAITDPAAYTPDACVLDLILNTNYGSQTDNAAYEALATVAHPILDSHRPFVPGLSPEDQEPLVRAYLLGAGGQDIAAANYYTNMLQRVPGAQPAVALRILLAAKDAARAELPFDPFNRDLINQILAPTQNSVDRASRPRGDDLRALIARQLVVAPYSPNVWSALGDVQDRSDPIGKLTAGDPYQQNAIVYSNHGAMGLSNFLEIKYNDHSRLRSEIERGVTPAPDPDVIDAALTCPILRLDRLRTAACASNAGAYGCTGLEAQQTRIAPIVADAVVRAVCTPERTADPATLRYSPHDRVAPPAQGH